MMFLLNVLLFSWIRPFRFIVGDDVDHDGCEVRVPVRRAVSPVAMLMRC